MPAIERPDGARIHYEVRGGGEPAILLASYWSWIPEVYAEIEDDLAADHRVANYHLRGTGESTREGPFDVETDIGDLEAVAEQVGGPLLLLATADASNRSVKLAARRPDLVDGVVCFGAGPFALSQFEGEEGMVTSQTVLDAFVEMVEANFRSAMRTFMEATNPQMSEEELRERVTAQAAFNSEQAPAGRLRGWLADDPRAAAQATGERLWIFAAADVAGPWLPPPDEVARITAETLPKANVVALEPGPISNPGGVAEAIRRIAAGRDPRQK